MGAILLQTLPFFGLIALGYGAGRTRFFSAEATAALTKFVFYFALSAMLFRFAATLSLGELISWPLIWAYLLGTGAVYLLATAVALIRRVKVEEAALEAQIAAEPRTRKLAEGVYASRSLIWGFPDITHVWSEDGNVHVSSHLVYGSSDLGVNRRRIEGWLAALN